MRPYLFCVVVNFETPANHTHSFNFLQDLLYLIFLCLLATRKLEMRVTVIALKSLCVCVVFSDLILLAGEPSLRENVIAFQNGIHLGIND